VIRDAGEGSGEPCLRIDAIQFGGLKQGVATAADLPLVCDPAKR
jgi:hypothetical protein